MTLERFERHLVCTRCPACGAVLGRDFRLFADHLETHAPEDFGLAPLRDRERQSRIRGWVA